MNDKQILELKIKDGWKLINSEWIGTALLHTLKRSNGLYDQICYITWDQANHMVSIETVSA